MSAACPGAVASSGRAAPPRRVALSSWRRLIMMVIPRWPGPSVRPRALPGKRGSPPEAGVFFLPTVAGVMAGIGPVPLWTWAVPAGNNAPGLICDGASVARSPGCTAALSARHRAGNNNKYTGKSHEQESTTGLSVERGPDGPARHHRLVARGRVRAASAPQLERRRDRRVLRRQ